VLEAEEDALEPVGFEVGRVAVAVRLLWPLGTADAEDDEAPEIEELPLADAQAALALLGTVTPAVEQRLSANAMVLAVSSAEQALWTQHAI